MVAPSLKQEQCFIELSQAVLRAPPAEVSTISGAFRHVRPVLVEEMMPVGLVIPGSVTVKLLAPALIKETGSQILNTVSQSLQSDTTGHPGGHQGPRGQGARRGLTPDLPQRVSGLRSPTGTY